MNDTHASAQYLIKKAWLISAYARVGFVAVPALGVPPAVYVLLTPHTDT